jgi:lambda family phage portal protein
MVNIGQTARNVWRNYIWPTPPGGIDASKVDIISVDDLPQYNYSASIGPVQAGTSFYDGEKYPGGYGFTRLYYTDYWTLRARSVQLFQENLYARGLIRRLITNEINTGLTLEATPVKEILGLSDDEADVWTEDTEAKFNIWAENPLLCDYAGLKTFYQLQAEARRTALVAGDVLVILRPSQVDGLPRIQLVDASYVQSTIQTQPRQGNKVVHGVEMNARGEHVAFWVLQDDGTSKRIPAYGEKTGRKIAWLLYGTDKRLNEVRGQPLLSIVLQSLREMDRNRDAEQRAAVVNAILALSVEKEKPVMSTLPISNAGGAQRRDVVVQDGNGTATRSFKIASAMPGLVVENLAEGEKLVAHDTRRPNVNYAAFEAAILSAVAWCNEVPPEIFMLQFHQNYSASRGAVVEFKLYLNRSRADFAGGFCKPIYGDWFLSEVFNNNIRARGFIEAYVDMAKQYYIFGAWLSSDWGGAIKAAVDLAAEVEGYQEMVKEGWITNDRASKELTGTKYSTNIKRIARENKQKAEAWKPIFALEQEFPGAVAAMGLERKTKPAGPRMSREPATPPRQ